MRMDFLLVLVLLATCALVFADEIPPRRQPVIDMHLHAYPPDDRFTSARPNPVTGQVSGVADGREHMEKTLAEMRRYNVVKAFVSGPIVVGGPEAALSWRDAAPDRIIASAGFAGSAASPLPELAALREAFRKGRYGALGEIGAQYAGLAIADPRYDPYLALAEDLDVPVGVHTGISFPGIAYEPCCRAFRSTAGNPQLIEEVLIRHPKLRLYLMHAGWPYTQETIALMRVYPHVYADLATINWITPRAAFQEHLQSLMNAGLGKRLMFGTDQMRWPEAIGMAIDGIESVAFLTPEQKGDIFCNDAARFLRWEGEKNPCQPDP